MDTREMVHGSTVIGRYFASDIEVSAAVEHRDNGKIEEKGRPQGRLMKGGNHAAIVIESD